VTEQELAQIEARAQAAPEVYLAPYGRGLLKDATTVAAERVDPALALFVPYAKGDILRLVAEVRRLRALLDETGGG
jgi:hypothetical protein